MADTPASSTNKLRSLRRTTSSTPVAPLSDAPGTGSLRDSDNGTEAWAPPPLNSIEDTGLNLLQLADLVLKILYYNGIMQGHEIADAIRLPYQNVLEDVMEFLKREKFVEIRGGGELGSASYRYMIGEKGGAKAREAMDRSQYAGPAPVPITTYVKAMHQQNDRNKQVNQRLLRRVMENLVVGDDMLSKIGPAINSKRSIFLYGPPGNGKTTLSEKIGRLVLGDDMYIPFAADVDGQIVQVLDSNRPARRHRAMSSETCTNFA